MTGSCLVCVAMGVPQVGLHAKSTSTHLALRLRRTGTGLCGAWPRTVHALYPRPTPDCNGSATGSHAGRNVFVETLWQTAVNPRRKRGQGEGGDREPGRKKMLNPSSDAQNWMAHSIGRRRGRNCPRGVGWFFKSSEQAREVVKGLGGKGGSRTSFYTADRFRGVFVLLCAWEFRPDPWLPEVDVPGSAPTESAVAAPARARARTVHHGDGGRPAALLPLRLLLLREPVRGALRAARAFPGRAAAARGLRPRECVGSGGPAEEGAGGLAEEGPGARGRWLCPRAQI